MRFDIVTLFPHMFTDFHTWGVTGRAITAEQVSIHTWNPRDYTHDRHASVDDRPYGGGPGMVMKYQPLADAINRARDADERACKVIYLSPQGQLFTQEYAQQLAKENRIILLAGRYEGIDERLISDYIDVELSIGDYVLSGGEFAAFVVMDSVIRLLAGVLGNAASIEQESFCDDMLDCPHYTRPEIINNQRVPGVLLSGNHQAIEQWRFMQSLGRTWLRRPNLLEKKQLTQQQMTVLQAFKAKREEDFLQE